jgi:hypothetical protein
VADADALLISKLIVASLEGGDAHTDLGKRIRDAASDFSAPQGLGEVRACLAGDVG